jgi:hypothetical protein
MFMEYFLGRHSGFGAFCREAIECPGRIRNVSWRASNQSQRIFGARRYTSIQSRWKLPAVAVTLYGMTA